MIDVSAFDTLFNSKMSFEGSVIEVCEEGRVVIRSLVHDSDVNPYGLAHGGYLFTLCDDAAGILGYTLGSYVVTQQASMSFIRSVPKGTTIFVESTCLHSGRSSKIAEVTIKDEKGTLFCKGTFTLFPVKKRDA